VGFGKVIKKTNKDNLAWRNQ